MAPTRKNSDDTDGLTARAFEEVGEKWSLLIVREATHGATRFDDFSRLGIASNILAARLARLVDYGILERRPTVDRANTKGYHLTAKGEALYPVIVALTQWSDDWHAPDGKAPIILVDAATGAPVEPIAVRAANGPALSYAGVRFAPGPGAHPATVALIAERNRKVLGQT